MTNRPPLALPAPLYVRLLAVLMTCVMSGVGVLALVSGHVGERWTRHGHAGPLDSSRAHSFGLTIFFFGLLPLMLVAHTPRVAMWIGGLAVALGLLSIFVGPALLG